MKRSKLFAILALASVTFCSGCMNSYEGGDDVSVEGDAFEKILAKYNDLDYSYSGESCTIKMAHWSGIGATLERGVIETVLKGFKRRYPTIDVNLDVLADYESVYSTRLAGDNVHDVFLMPDGDFPSWARSNKALNLTPFIEGSSLIEEDAMYQSALTRYRYNPTTGLPSDNGVTLALPKDIGPMVLYYNKDAFDDAGVAYPSNKAIMDIHDATEMWKKLVKKNSKGDVTRYALSDITIEGLVWSAGGDFLNEDRTAFPTDEKTLTGLKNAYQWMQDAYVNDCIMPPAEFTVGSDGATLFGQQKVACFVGLKANVTSFRNLTFNWDICQIPAFDKDPTHNSWSGSVGYSVYNGSAHTEAAWKLVEYIASREGQELLSATGFQIPLYKDIARQESFLEGERELGPQNFDVFLDAAETQSYGTWQYRSNNLWKTYGYDATSELLFSSNPATRMSVDEFLTKAKTEVTKYLS